MGELISPEESYRIIREAWDVFSRTDSNGNSFYEYEYGDRGSGGEGLWEEVEAVEGEGEG